jgi:formylglycine-generating enzyme required for sulfatase activity
MKKQILLLLLLFSFNLLKSNNLQISNFIASNKNISAGANHPNNHFFIYTSLSWENSWRTNNLNGDGVENWDAVWIFAKYRVNNTGEWKHVNFSNSGHIVPNNTNLEVGLHNHKIPFDQNSNPVVGMFLYRKNNGSGTFDINNLQLKWNYALQNISDTDSVEVQVFGIEMVYVPKGAFYIGSTGNEAGRFHDADDVTKPFFVASEAEITTANSGSGNLWGLAGTNSASGVSNVTTATTIPIDFPKGFESYYCMKYEITQSQYVDFLNKQTRIQQNNLTATDLSVGIDNVSNRYVMSNTASVERRNGIKCNENIDPNESISFYCDLNNNGIPNEINDGQWIACNFISYRDFSAYMDWSGLRIMTEFEYEKSSRGIKTPKAEEFSWGENIISTSAYTISNEGRINESINTNYSTTLANAAFTSTTGTSSTVAGPLRTGVFATNNSTKNQAGASYYGIMELTGNVWERVVSVRIAAGRNFNGIHGDGLLSTNGYANENTWPGLTSGEVTAVTGVGLRGGFWGSNQANSRVSNRGSATNTSANRENSMGGRGVRSTLTNSNSTNVPILTTTELSNINSNSAVSGGNIINQGGSPVTARGVVWSDTPNPTLANSLTSNGTGIGNFTSNITGLSLSTTYYVRAYATNSFGTAYGNEIQLNPALAVGENYLGGRIAYILQPGDAGYVANETHGFIVSIADVGSSQWGCRGNLVSGTSNLFGAGLNNTNIINQYHDNINYLANPSQCNIANDGSVAAKLCEDLVLNGFSDWYLPSINELEIIYQNRLLIGGISTSGSYWSSTEISANEAYYFFFSLGIPLDDFKTNTRSIRAIRNF